MCIIVYKPANTPLFKKRLKACYSNNEDGCGFVYPSDKKNNLVIERGVFTFREFWRKYREIPKDKPVLLHFRIQTSGDINENNCHPFLIDKGHALAHNGNIESKLNEKLTEKSDTATFVEKVLQPLFKDKKLKKGKFWTTEAFEWLLEESVGSNNKMVIMDADGFVKIYNEKQGEWDEKVWYSNKSFKQNRKKTSSKKSETIVENGFTKVKTQTGENHSRFTYHQDGTKKEESPYTGESGVDLAELF